MTTPADTADTAIITQAVTILKQGGLVAFPTETVYGLGADAGNPDAVQKIFDAKGRPSNHPLIVHVGKPEQLNDWARNIPRQAWRLAEEFWPGPLAMILEKAASVPLTVTGGQQTVALRMPDNSLALDLLSQFGGGIAAPSANRFNHISPTLAEHVRSELGDSVDLILDGGACSVGLESTIIDLTGSQPRLLRPGHISPQQIEQVLHVEVIAPQYSEIRVPGRLEVHYAPTTPTVMFPGDKILQQIENLTSQGKRFGILAHSQSFSGLQNCAAVPMPSDPETYAHDLYAALRQLDNQHLDIIMVETLPDDGEWLAINDRLIKATASNSVL